MKKLLFAIPFLLIAQLAEAQNYGFYREIDFPTPASTLTNITVSLCFNETLPNGAVCPTATGLNALGGGAHVKYRSGFDIAFGNAGNSTCGTRTNWQMDNYNPTTGALQAQVKVTLSSGGGNKVFMCYGDTTTVSFKGGALGTNYDASVQLAYPLGYAGNPSNAATDGTDFSGHGNNGTAITSLTEVAGMLGGAANAAMGSNGSLQAPLTNIGFTAGHIAWWANTSDTFNDSLPHSWWGQFDNVSTAMYAIKDGSNNINVIFQDGTGASVAQVAASSGNFPTNTWVKYDFTWTVGGSGILYVNGASVATTASWGHSNNIGVSIGLFGTPNLTAPFDGSIDNFIIDNTARSALWISTQYTFENAPASNETVNAETSTGGGGTGIPPCDTTVNGDPVSISNAYNTVPNGGVICLNSGTFQFSANSHVQILNKFVEIRGNGFITASCPSSNSTISGGCGSAGLTILHMCGPTSPAPCTASGDGFFFTGNEIFNGNVIIDNIQFQYDSKSFLNKDSEGTIAATDNGGTGGQPWIIHHDDFFGVGGDFNNPTGPLACQGPTWIGFASNAEPVFGLVYRNHFNSVPSFYTACGAGLNFNNSSVIGVGMSVGDPTYSVWQSSPTYGSADDGYHNLYIETNVFEGFNSASDFSPSARVVARFNYMNGASFTGHGFDADITGVRHGELYNNNFACTTFSTTPFGAGGSIQLTSWATLKSGTFKVFNNLWPLVNFSSNPSCADAGLSFTNLAMHLLKLESQGATLYQAYPGVNPSSYPLWGNFGWGYSSGGTVIGQSTQQNQPGINQMTLQDGGKMDLEPMYAMNNVNNTANDVFNIASGYVGDSRAYATSNAAAGTVGTTMAVNNYAATGQTVVVGFADAVGGVAPTIANTCIGGGGAQTWTALAGSPATNGNTRLSLWYTKWTGSACGFTATVTFPSSSASRSMSVVVLRGLLTGTPDANPTMNTSTSATTFTGPSTGTLSNANEIVLGFNALADNINDNINPASLNLEAISQAAICNNTGFNGTAAGGADVSITSVYQAVSSTAPVSPAVTAATASNSVNATVSFVVNGTTGVNSPLDLHTTDLVNVNSGTTGTSREGYQEVNDASPCQTSSSSPFAGTVGTGCGTRALRPTTCTTGVGYWALDDANNWNATHAGTGTLFMGTTYFNGAMDKCTSTNTWTNASYVPATYPNVLANITSGPAAQAFTVQPTNTISGNAFSPVVVVSVIPAAADSITLSINSGSCTLSGTTTVTASAGGVATFTGVGVTGTPTANCTLKSHDNTNAGVPDVVSNSFNQTGTVAFTAQPSNVVSGSAFSPTIVVTTTPSSTDSITISVSNGTCTLGGTTTVSAVAGVATFTGVTGVTLGAGCILLAHDSTNTSYTDNTSNAFNVTGTTTFSSQPTTTVNSHQFSPTITVTVAPAAQTATDSITLSVASGTCSLTGTTTVTAVANVATFTALTANALGSNCVLRAHDNTHTTVADILSNQFNITGTLFYSQQPTNTVSGQAFSPTITVMTSPSKAGDSLTIAVTTGSCTLSGTTSVTTSATGAATFTGVTANAIGTGCVLTVDDDSNTLYTPNASATFNITNPPIPVLSFTNQPGTIVSGTTFSPVVIVSIVAASPDSITLFINSCGSTLTGTSTVTASGGGVATFTGLGATGAGAACTLRAHDNTNSAVLDVTSNNFNVTGAPPPVMSFQQQPTNVNTGSAFSPVVKVAFNNTGVTDTVTLTMNSCGASLTGPTSQAAVSSVATYTGLGANVIASNCTITAHDVTNSAVADIISNAFIVSGVPGATGQSNNIILQQVR